MDAGRYSATPYLPIGITCLYALLYYSIYLLFKFENFTPHIRDQMAEANSEDAVKSAIILIGGGSASGKTTIAQQLAKNLVLKYVSAQCISMDNFYRSLSPDENGETFNWDDPSAYDVRALVQCIEDWRAGRACWIPHHDFSQYKSVEKSKWVQPSQVMVIEGIHALSIGELAQFADLKIYVHCDHDEALARRITRDINERGYTLEIVLMRYFKYVKPALKEIIEPSQKNADFIINNNNGALEGGKAIELIADALSNHSRLN